MLQSGITTPDNRAPLLSQIALTIIQGFHCKSNNSENYNLGARYAEICSVKRPRSNALVLAKGQLPEKKYVFFIKEQRLAREFLFLVKVRTAPIVVFLVDELDWNNEGPVVGVARFRVGDPLYQCRNGSLGKSARATDTTPRKWR